MYRFIFSLTILLVGSYSMARGSPEYVPVHEETRHRLVFDKTPVKIVNVNIPVGDISKYHLHDAPTLYVAISGAPMRSQDLGKEWLDPNPSGLRRTGQIIFRNYREGRQVHRVENIGDRPFRLFGIIHQGEGVGDSAVDERVEFENNWFRTYRWKLKPGQVSAAHSYDFPVVVVQVSHGSSSVLVKKVPMGEKTVIGNWSWHSRANSLTLRNDGDTDVELVEVVIKDGNQ